MTVLLSLLHRGASLLDWTLLALLICLPLSSLLPPTILGGVLLFVSLLSLGVWLSLRLAAPVAAPLQGWGWLALPLLWLLLGVLSLVPGLAPLPGLPPGGVNDTLRRSLALAFTEGDFPCFEPQVMHRVLWVAVLVGGMIWGVIARDRLRSVNKRRRGQLAALVGGGLFLGWSLWEGLRQGLIESQGLLTLLSLGPGLLALSWEWLGVKGGAGKALGGPFAAGVVGALGIGCVALALVFIGDAHHYLWATAFGVLPLVPMVLKPLGRGALGWGLVCVLGLGLVGAGLTPSIQQALLASFLGHGALSTWPLGRQMVPLGVLTWVGAWVCLYWRMSKEAGTGLLFGAGLVSVGGALALVSHTPLPMGLLMMMALAGAFALGGLKADEKVDFEPTLLWGRPPAKAYLPLLLATPLSFAALGLPFAVPSYEGGGDAGTRAQLRFDALDPHGLASLAELHPAPQTCLLPWDPLADAPWLACLGAAVEGGWMEPKATDLFADGLFWPSTLEGRLGIAQAVLLEHPELAEELRNLPVPAALALGGGDSPLSRGTKESLLLAAALPTPTPERGEAEAGPVLSPLEDVWALALTTDGGGVLSPALRHHPIPKTTREDAEALGRALVGCLPSAAVQTYLVALQERVPQSTALLLMVAEALGEAGEPEAGARMLATSPLRSPSLRALTLALQAQAGECDLALEGARPLGDAHLKDGALQLRLSEVYGFCNEPVQRIVSLERAKESRPKDPEIRVRLSKVYEGTRHDGLLGKRGHILRTCIEELEPLGANGPCCDAYEALGAPVQRSEGVDGPCVVVP